MTPKERLERLEDLVQELLQLNMEVPVLVEGMKDERTLRELGAKGEVIRMNKGVPVFSMCEDISRKHRRVILLTDWDRRGGHLAMLLKEGLEANGVRYDADIRAEIATLTKKDIKDVESLGRHLERLRGLASSGVGGVK